MRKSFKWIFAIFVIASVFCGVGCKPEVEVKVKTGSVEGTAKFQNAINHAGIKVSLFSTDGLMAVDYYGSRGIDTNVRSSTFEKTTDENGAYRFDNVPEGVYTIVASSASSKEKAIYASINVRASESLKLETLQLTATGSIKGSITIDGNTYGNTGFLVFVAGTSYMAMTDDYGNYIISDVPAERSYQIVASKDGVIYNLNSSVWVTANKTTIMANHNFSSLELEERLKGEQGEQGIQGEKGLDGVSFNWLGAFDSADEIIEPKYLDAYFNKTDGCSYIWDGEEWTLLARAGRDGVINGEEARSLLQIGTLLSTEEMTNQSVEITVNLTKTELKKKGYVYSVEEPYFANPDDVLNNSEFVSMKKDSDGKYKIMAEENGYYTIAVKDNEDAVSFTQEQITNIDRSSPEIVSALQAKYDIDSTELTVTWKNPTDSDFVHVELSYTKRGILQVENTQTINETYSIKNVRVDGSEYIFTLFAVDQAGNKSDAVTVSIVPKGYSVGDVLLNDGTILPYGTATYKYKYMAVGVCYALDTNGKPKGWLGIYNSVSKNSDGYYWQKWHGMNANQNFYNIWCSPSSNEAATATFTGVIDGSGIWNYINSNGGSADDFPAFNYINNYSSTYSLTGDYATGWYMPSLAELCDIYKNKNILNSVLREIGGTLLNDTDSSESYYWSSSESKSSATKNIYAMYVNFCDGEAGKMGKSNNHAHVCCIRKYK